MLKRTMQISAISAALLLSGCVATDENLLRPPWADEPLLTSPQCNSLSVDNVLSFMIKYEAYGAGGGSAQAGKKAMEKYTLASALINRANLCLAEALELKDVTESLLKEQKILLGGTSLSDNEMETHRAISMNASEAIRQATGKISQVSPEQTTNFVIGTVAFLGGAYETIRIKSAIDPLLDDLKSAASGNYVSAGFGLITAAVSGGNAIYTISTGLPDHLSNIWNTGMFLLDYAQSEDLDLPSDATDKFTSLAGWD